MNKIKIQYKKYRLNKIKCKLKFLNRINKNDIY